MMRSTEMSMDDQIRSIHHKYQIPEDEAKEILSRGFRFNDVDKAALLSCLSGKTAGEILVMRKDDPWGRIEKKLGLTPEIYSKRYIAHRADRLHRFYGMDAREQRHSFPKATRTTGSASPTSSNSTQAA